MVKLVGMNSLIGNSTPMILSLNIYIFVNCIISTFASAATGMKRKRTS